MAVTLRQVTTANRALVESLRVSPAQEGFVDGVSRSLAEAAATPTSRPWYRAVYAGETPVGFVMLADDVPPGDPDIPWRYYLWRMLIDHRHQGRGLGRAALDQVCLYLHTRPDADALVTASSQPRGPRSASIWPTASSRPETGSTTSRCCGWSSACRGLDNPAVPGVAEGRPSRWSR